MIFILLPVHNRKDVTERFIRCLISQSYKEYHLVLIDDGSIDGTADMIRVWAPSATIIRGSGRWWWGGALHQGYKWIVAHAPRDSTYVLLINDDTEFQSDFLDIGLSVLDRNPRTLLLAQSFSRQTGALVDSGVKIDWKIRTIRQARNPDEINCLSTRGLFIRTVDFLDIGGFHPHLLPHYASDYEFTVRAWRKGYRLMTAPEWQLWKDETTSGDRTRDYESVFDFFRRYFSKRNPDNIVYRLSFFFLASPWNRKIPNLFGVFFQSGMTLMRKIFQSMTGKPVDRVNR